MIDTIIEALRTHEQLFWLLGLGSIALLVGTALAIPWLIIALPRDFFARTLRANEKKPGPRRAGSVVLAIIRNLAGVALLVAGIVMLFVPGQGLLTILIAVALIDFPGKHALLLKLINNPRIFGAANGIRRWARKPEFVPPGFESGGVVPSDSGP